jgi:hypothetical protein
LLVAHAAPDGILGSIHRRTCERVILDLLEKVKAHGRHVSDSRNSGNYAPRLFAQRPDREGFGKDDFSRAMEMLFSRNEITTAPYGRSGDKRHEIVRVADHEHGGTDTVIPRAAVCGGPRKSLKLLVRWCVCGGVSVSY